jgi:hypothetical protein
MDNVQKTNNGINSSTLKMEAAGSTEMSVHVYQAPWHCFPENSDIHDSYRIVNPYQVCMAGITFCNTNTMKSELASGHQCHVSWVLITRILGDNN